MTKSQFLETIAKTQKEQAKILGIKQPAVSKWSYTKSTSREKVLLAGWALLTPQQRNLALSNAGF